MRVCRKLTAFVSRRAKFDEPVGALPRAASGREGGERRFSAFHPDGRADFGIAGRRRAAMHRVVTAAAFGLTLTFAVPAWAQVDIEGQVLDLSFEIEDLVFETTDLIFSVEDLSGGTADIAGL